MLHNVSFETATSGIKDDSGRTYWRIGSFWSSYNHQWQGLLTVDLYENAAASRIEDRIL